MQSFFTDVAIDRLMDSMPSDVADLNAESFWGNKAMYCALAESCLSKLQFLRDLNDRFR